MRGNKKLLLQLNEAKCLNTSLIMYNHDNKIKKEITNG